MPVMVGELVSTLGLDKSAYTQGLKDAGKEADTAGARIEARMEKLGAAFSKVGKSMSMFVTLPLVGIATAFVKTAITAEETASKFATVFKSVAKDARMVAKNLADNFGLSSLKAKELLANTGDLLSGFGFTGEAALDLSDQVNQLAVDLASFTNYSGGAEGASQALTKALLGERESLKILGIAILETDVQSKVLELTQQGITFETERQAKAYATLILAQEQSKNAIGDFARTSDSAANQIRMMLADVQDLAVSFGEILIPIVKNVVTSIRNALQWFTGLDKGTKKMILTILGIVAAVGPVLLIIGKLITTVGILTGAVAKFNLVALAGPLGIIALVAAAGIGIVALIKHVTTADERFVALKTHLVETNNSTASMIDRYRMLAGQLEKTAEEEKEIGELASKLLEIYPELNFLIDKNTGEVMLNTEELTKEKRALLEANIALLQEVKARRESIVVKQLDRLELGKISAEVDNFGGNMDDFNKKAMGVGIQLLRDFEAELSEIEADIKAAERALAIFDGTIVETNEDIEETSRKLQTVEKTLTEMSIELRGNTFKALAEIDKEFAGLGDIVDINAKKLGVLLDALILANQMGLGPTSKTITMLRAQYDLLGKEVEETADEIETAESGLNTSIMALLTGRTEMMERSTVKRRLAYQDRIYAELETEKKANKEKLRLAKELQDGLKVLYQSGWDFIKRGLSVLGDIFRNTIQAEIDLVIEKYSELTQAELDYQAFMQTELEDRFSELTQAEKDYQAFLKAKKDEQYKTLSAEEKREWDLREAALAAELGRKDAAAQAEAERLETEAKLRDAAKDAESKRLKDMDDERKQLQYDQAVASKNFAYFEAVIGGAQAIIAGLLTKPFLPVGLAMGVLAGVLTGAQILAIKSQPLPKLLMGGLVNMLEGGMFLGKGGVDTNVAALTSGEYVVPPAQTAKYINELEQIRKDEAPGTSVNIEGVPVAMYMDGREIGKAVIEFMAVESDKGNVRVNPKAIRANT